MSVAPYFAPPSGAYNRSVGPATVGHTPAGVRGFQMDFKGFADLGNQRNLFGESMQANFSQLWASGNQTTNTIESNVYGQVYTTLSAVATYRDVCALGYWTQRLLPVYEITYIHRVQQRYFYRTIRRAQRSGHLDTQKSGSQRMFSFQRTGHRNSATAYARHEELYGPPEYAVVKRDFMMDELFYGHAHAHAHDLVDALIRETYVRYWIESGGTRMTNERFMVDEMLRVADTFGLLNYGAMIAASRLAQYANQVPGPNTQKVGVLPYAARRIHAGLVRAPQIPIMMGMVNFSPYAALTLGTGLAIDRNLLVPPDASLDNLITDPNQVPKAYGNLDGIQIYLEPPVELETAKNNDYDTLLVHYSAKSEYYRHGLLGENSTNAMPHIFKLYDATTDRREIVNSVGEETLAAVGVWKTMGSSYDIAHYPGFGGVVAGFSDDFRNYASKFANSPEKPSTFSDYVSRGYEARESQNMYSLKESGEDANAHIFVSNWGQWGPAAVIGGMYPHNLRHWDSLRNASAFVECADAAGSHDGSGNHHATASSFVRLADELISISDYFSDLLPSDAWAAALAAANPEVVVAKDGVLQLDTDSRGGYIVPQWSDPFPCEARNYLAGFGSGPLLETLAETVFPADAPAPQMQRVKRLQAIIPLIREKLTTMQLMSKHNPILARNTLPAWFAEDKVSLVTNFIVTAVTDNHYWVSPADKAAEGSMTVDALFEKIFRSYGVSLIDPDEVDAANGLAAQAIKAAAAEKKDQVNEVRKSAAGKSANVQELLKSIDDGALGLMLKGISDISGKEIAANALQLLETVAKAGGVSSANWKKEVQKKLRDLYPAILKAPRKASATNGFVRTCLSFTDSLINKTKGKFGCTRFLAGNPTTNFSSPLDGDSDAVITKHFKPNYHRNRSVDRAGMRGGSETREPGSESDKSAPARSADFGADLDHLRRRTRLNKLGVAPGKHDDSDSDSDDDSDDPVRTMAHKTTMLQTSQVLPAWQRNLILWRLDQFARERGDLTTRSGFFFFLTYIMTPLLGDTMLGLARTCHAALPFTVLNLRVGQVFVTFDMVFAQQFCVRVHRSPTLVFLQSGGPLQTIEITSKVASNEFVDDPRKVIRVPEVYLHRQAGGRGTKPITPAASKQWRTEHFTMFNKKESIVPALERIAQPNYDAIDLHNKPSAPLMEEIARGTLNMGPWTSQRFTVHFSHADYFNSGMKTYNDAKNSLPQDTSQLNKFITGFGGAVSNYRNSYHGYNIATFADLSSRQTLMTPVIFRGTIYVSEQKTSIKSAKFNSERPGSPFNPLSRHALNEKGLNSRLLLDQMLEDNRVTMTKDDY